MNLSGDNRGHLLQIMRLQQDNVANANTRAERELSTLYRLQDEMHQQCFKFGHSWVRADDSLQGTADQPEVRVCIFCDVIE